MISCEKMLWSILDQQEIGSVTYELKLPLTMKIHLAFHIPYLKKIIRNDIPT